jgi:hypothetical protein
LTRESSEEASLKALPYPWRGVTQAAFVGMDTGYEGINSVKMRWEGVYR